MALRLIAGGPMAVGGGPPLDDERLEELYRSPEPAGVRANFVVSLDGAVEVNGRSAALSGRDDHIVFTTLRALADVIVVGSATARIENYGPARLSPAASRRRVERGQALRPPVAVLTNRADLDPDARLFCEAMDQSGAVRPLVLTCGAAPEAARAALGRRAEVVICGEASVDVIVAMEALRSRGLCHLLCEGGPTVLSALLAEAAVDELCLAHTPVVAGPGHSALVVGRAFGQSVATRLIHLLAGDGFLFGRYQVLPQMPAEAATDRPPAVARR